MKYERQMQLYEILKSKGSATVGELAGLLYTSEASVRRDIAQLESSGLVTRVYGGVLLSNFKNSELPLGLRDIENSKEKEGLAKKAASYINDGMTVILDSSSTVRRIVKYISHLKDVRIVTNSLSVVEDAKDLGFDVYCVGGMYNRKGNDLLGPSAEAYVSTISADICFFSAEAIDNDGEITDISEERNSLRRAMMARAKRRVFLCDSSKLGMRRTFTLCKNTDVDDIICDVPLAF